jgi:hypothetical protein
MSKFDEAMEVYTSAASTLGVSVDAELLTKVAKGLGPSIYNADSSLVSGSDPEELARVKNNFLIGKLGLADSPALDEAIAEVIQTFGSSNRNKHRALFYYLLVKKFGQEGFYA